MPRDLRAVTLTRRKPPSSRIANIYEVSGAPASVKTAARTHRPTTPTLNLTGGGYLDTLKTIAKLGLGLFGTSPGYVAKAATHPLAAAEGKLGTQTVTLGGETVPTTEGIFPWPSPAKAAERAAAKTVAKAYEPRTLTVGEKTQQLPKARSRITQTVIEKPADKASKALMADTPTARAARKILPTASAGARVAKAAGRETALEAQRATAKVAPHIQALPKEGSPEDVAHFWWAQMPKALRNAGGLAAVRAKQAAELERIHSGKALEGLQKQAGAIQAKMRAATDAERFDLMGDLQDVKTRISDLPQVAKDVAVSVAQLDKVIAKPPTVNEKIIAAVHALGGDRQKVLEDAGLLEPARAAERRGLVSKWLGVEPTGEEAFIGHRLDRVRGAQSTGLPGSPGTGRARIPQGVSRENKLVLARQGRLRPSTRVAAEDWQASQTYRSAVRARDDLSKMGSPFEGHVPKGYSLLNPKGRAVPPAWKTDQLAKLVHQGHDEAAIRKAAEEVTSGFLASPDKADELVKAAREQGVKWDELRVVPDRVVNRYYGQFAPARSSSIGGRAYDNAINFTAASIIFARVGYIPKNIAQNLIMAAPHQGAYLLANVPRAAQVLRDPELRALFSAEVGTGATGALGQEFTAKLLGAPGKAAQAVSAVADTPLRISALINELAAEHVIPRLSPVLSEKDKQALIKVFTDPKERPLLNDARSRGVEAMADFSRMTPQQRKWLRRFLIIPGWLHAGSRYPIHFAATHPGRSAALAYAAAGEPGAPDRFKVNKPINEYFAKGMPSWLPGVDVGGGKLLRTGSISPVSTPWEIAGAALGTSPRAIPDYANPLATALYHLANREIVTSSGETKKVGYGQALKENALGLAPSVSFARDELHPPASSPTRIYPDTSRIGRLKRELGVVPVKVNKEAAQQAALRERGMTQSVAVLSDKRSLLDTIKQAGHKPSKQLEDAYALRLERAKRLDTIKAHGLTYQQKAYRSDIQLLVQRGAITPQEATATLKAAAGATEEQLKSWRAWLGKNKFGGDTIAGVKKYLHEQAKTQPAAATG